MYIKQKRKPFRFPLAVRTGLVIGVAAFLAKNPAPGHGLYVYKTKTETFRFLFAVRTGLEPVTPCVTGMYSNQLN